MFLSIVSFSLIGCHPSPKTRYVKISYGCITGDGGTISLAIECNDLQYKYNEAPDELQNAFSFDDIIINKDKSYNYNHELELETIIDETYGEKLQLNVDVSAYIGGSDAPSAYGPYQEYVYKFMDDQPPSIPIYNQFYIKFPNFNSTTKGVHIVNSANNNAYDPAYNFNYNTFFRLTCAPMLDTYKKTFSIRFYTKPYSLYANDFHFMTSDGNLHTELTIFDENILINSGSVLDLSNLNIDF